MNNLNAPVYLIALRDLWLVDKSTGATLAFVTLRDARDEVAETAAEEGVPRAALRIVEFKFTGKVLEG